MTSRQSGFTLLEVLVSVAILGISLVAIFSSTVGAVRAGFESDRIATSSLLARCTMAELEEEIARTGFPAIDATEEAECCEGNTPPGFRCRWTVNPVVLPDEYGGEEGEEGEGGGGIGGLLGGGTSLTDVAETGNVSELLAAGTEGDIISEMALSIAFPLLKPAIEDQVRRATVTVWWGEDVEGSVDECAPADPCMSVVQFLVAEPGTGSGDGDDDV